MVVFPSWLPFFLYDSSRKDKTQRTQKRTQRQKHAKRSDKGRSVKRNARKKPAHYPKS